MARFLTLAAIFLLGVLVGGWWRAPQDVPAQADVMAPEAQAAKADPKLLEQLRDIQQQLKELNTMFRTGTAKVIPVINPDRT